MKIYDISRTISSQIAVWPGDQPFSISWTMEIPNGSTVNLSAITMSVHTGTHADAPFHYDQNSKKITEIDLSNFIGPAFVVRIPDAEQIEIRHIEHLDFSSVKRVLFQTKSSWLEDDVWIDEIVPLGTETAEYLGQQDVQLVGLDAPSVDPVHSKELSTHKMLARYGIVNLESLLLRDVPEGEYQLIALPLKLKDLDASPVRAILIEQD